MVKEKECTSCKKRIINDPSSVSFTCPNCLEVIIIRCGECRKKAIKYRCSKCKFEGP
ncbi:MAG: DUF1610 domain-containing protein [Candidatus Woesearchaeota archaeon]|nr:MAG: DUF1610 domain-containing protein [Candidatus Woesearchaeota archaeon]